MDNTPIFARNMRGAWGPREGGRFQLLSEHQGWRYRVNKLITSVLEPGLTSTIFQLFLAAAQPADGGVCAARRAQPLSFLLS